MRRILGVTLVLTVVASGLARAQATTASMLDSAKMFYQDLEIARSLPLLRNIISPSSPYEVTRSQRVEAYKYLGAALALQGRPDSASMYFRAAIERDPFTDLDPLVFAASEIQAFDLARQQTFAVGVRDLGAMTLVPGADRLTLRAVTTHAADVRAVVRAVSGGAEATLYSGTNDGIREIDWNGLVGGGAVAPEGRYELVVDATSERTGRADTARSYFDIVHERPPLEDTLPSLREAELLPEQHAASAAPLELLKGLGVAGAAFLVPTVVGSGDLGREFDVASGAVAGAGVITGVVGFFLRRSNRAIPANIQANQERRSLRARQNQEIQGRNAARIRETRLVITPVSGAGQ